MCTTWTKFSIEEIDAIKKFKGMVLNNTQQDDYKYLCYDPKWIKKNMKILKETEYMYVDFATWQGQQKFVLNIPEFSAFMVGGDCDRIAKEVDKTFIRHNKRPVNGFITPKKKRIKRIRTELIRLNFKKRQLVKTNTF